MKLNLACGQNKREGWFNVDVSPQVKPDWVADLLKFPWDFFVTDPIAFPRGPVAGKIEEIHCSHFIEHIGDELIPFMEECYRVLEPGGTAHFVMPYYTSIRAWQDPTHKRPISEFTFHYFNHKWLKEQGLSHYNVKADFDIQEIRYHYPNGMQGMSEEELRYMREHAWNTVADFEVVLKARKGDTNNQSMGRETLTDA